MIDITCSPLLLSLSSSSLSMIVSRPAASKFTRGFSLEPCFVRPVDMMSAFSKPDRHVQRGARRKPSMQPRVLLTSKKYLGSGPGHSAAKTELLKSYIRFSVLATRVLRAYASNGGREAGGNKREEPGFCHPSGWQLQGSHSETGVCYWQASSS